MTSYIPFKCDEIIWNNETREANIIKYSRNGAIIRKVDNVVSIKISTPVVIEKVKGGISIQGLPTVEGYIEISDN